MRRMTISMRAVAVLLISCVLPACDRGNGKPVASPNTPASAGVPATSQPLHARSHQDAGSNPETFRTPGELCGNNRACLDSPLIASSPEELAWLRVHGYPSVSELRTLRAEPTGVLESDAARGNLTAKVVLGARLISEGSERTGFDHLMRAADAGSIYAYYELSNARMRSGRNANHVDAAAFLRLAYILGDWKASIELERRFPAFGPSERLFVDERAASLYRTFAHGRRPEPRPMERK